MVDPVASVLARIDPHCEAFEQAWLAGQPRLLEHFLPTDWAREDRLSLFQHLLELDVDYRRRGGEKVSRADYISRFAEFADIIDTVLAEQVTSDSPRSIGRYAVVARIGAGGMGVVFRCFDPQLKRPVAIKVLRHDGKSRSSASARFERELAAIGRLDHPHIVRALDAGEVDGSRYLVMEYVPGCDLGTVVRRHGSLPIADACELIRQTAKGLEEVRSAGMVHRDIKPSNLLLTPSGHVKLADLGLALASHTSQDNKTEQTSVNTVLGTPDYMSPEQYGNSHTVDIRADIYSLGATLYRLLAGEPPLQLARCQTPMQTIVAIASKSPRRLDEVRREIPKPLADLVARMLSKDPTKRQQTPAEVAQALTPYCWGASVARLVTEENHSAFASAEQGTVAMARVDTGPIEPVRNVTGRQNSAATEGQDNRSDVCGKSGLSSSIVRRVITTSVFVCIVIGILVLVARQNRTRIDVSSSNIEVRVNDDPVAIQSSGKSEGITISDQSPPPGKRWVLEFTKIDHDRVEMEPMVTLDTVECTIEMWVTPMSSPEGYSKFWSNAQGNISLVQAYDLGRGILKAYYQFYTCHGHISSEPIYEAGRRIHLAGVNDGQQRLLFLNGKLIASDNDAGTVCPDKNPLPMYLGGKHFTGQIESVHISHVGRYTKEFTPPTTFTADKHTTALYLFNEGQGDVLKDSSGNGHHGKIIGAKWVLLTEDDASSD